jgi:hypothetical protein
VVRLLRLAAAALAVAAAGVVVPSPAHASTCDTAAGVSVVVDFHQLGGGVQTFCDTGGAGKSAAEQFADAGHTLTYVQGEPFVCQVDSKPDTQCARTPPSNAYWSLWWSDGKSGEWKYASAGVTALEVPDGGYVAFSWQGQASQAKPRVTPTAHTASTPSSSPSSSPSTHAPSSPHSSTAPGQAGPPSHSTTTTPGSTAPSSGTTPADGPTGRGGHHQHSDAPKAGKAGTAPGKAAHGHDQTQAGEPLEQVATSTATDDSDGSGSDGLPAWIAPVAIAVLFLGAGTIVVVRRKSNGGS